MSIPADLTLGCQLPDLRYRPRHRECLALGPHRLRAIVSYLLVWG